MLVRGATVLAIVTGGIALGAILGTAANPEMKQPPERPWQGALHSPMDADTGYQRLAEGLSPYESYAPSWANEELTDREPDYPAWTYSDLSVVEEDPAAPSLDQHPEPLDPEALVSPDAPPQPDFPPEPQIAGSLAALY